MQNQRGPAFSNDYFQEEPGDLTYAQNPVLDNLIAENLRQQEINDEKTHKSELNVVLMPKAMPLIGFDKYKNVQRSFESLNSKELEDLSASQQNLCIVTPEQQALNDTLTVSASFPSVLMENSSNTEKPEDLNPFFFGNLKDNYVNSDYFNMRYNPDNFPSKPDDSNKTETEKKSISPKTNQLNTPSAEEKSENEENLKFQTSTKPENEKKTEKKIENTPKTPKLSIRRKVSIHFKGKKEKEKLKKQGAEASTTPETKTGSSKATPTESKKHSIFDIKFREKDLKDTKKDNEKQTKGVHQKTPSIESKKSTTETSNLEPKTPTSTESKNSDKKNSVTIENKKDATERGKSRKSASVSPDRSRHVQMKEEGSSRKHKKHKRPDRGGRSRRTSNSDPRHLRERSYSVCTDRSNVLDARLGLGLGLGFGSSYLYDEYSDRERTNSFSSCDTAQSHRKLSTISNVPLNGKLPWCGCWGNGCL